MEAGYWLDAIMDNRPAPHSPFNTGSPLSIRVFFFSVWMTSIMTGWPERAWQKTPRPKTRKHNWANIKQLLARGIKLLSSVESSESRHKSPIRHSSAVPVDPTSPPTHTTHTHTERGTHSYVPATSSTIIRRLVAANFPLFPRLKGLSALCQVPVMWLQGRQTGGLGVHLHTCPRRHS